VTTRAFPTAPGRREAQSGGARRSGPRCRGRCSGRTAFALAAALAFSAGCAAARSPEASGLPREALPATFAPLRWSVRPADVPVLLPNREARSGEWSDGVKHLTWSVADVRRVSGVPGALLADFADGGALWMARLSFADPRRECDPDLADRPRHCVEPGPALAAVYAALEAELARGRGAPKVERGAHGARSASWPGGEIGLWLTLRPGVRGAWAAQATAMPRSTVGERSAPPR